MQLSKQLRFNRNHSSSKKRGRKGKKQYQAMQVTTWYTEQARDNYIHHQHQSPPCKIFVHFIITTTTITRTNIVAFIPTNPILSFSCLPQPQPSPLKNISWTEHHPSPKTRLFVSSLYLPFLPLMMPWQGQKIRCRPPSLPPFV